MSSSLHSFALQRIESLVNGALGYDPGSKQQLSRLAGKVIAIHSTFPPESVVATILENGEISLSPIVSGHIDTELRGSPVSLALLFLKASETTSFANSGVTIVGDQELIISLGRILSDLDVDWEEALAQLIGDTPAHLASKAVRSAGAWHKDSALRSASGIGEFIREESGLTLSRAEAESWFKSTRHLAADADRLAARFDRLKARLDKSGH